MNLSSSAGPENAFATLRRFAQPRSVDELCEFCGVAVAPVHRHLLEPATRKIICACDPCALRFENVVGRWKLVPRDPRPLPCFVMSDVDWAALALPIQLVFIFRHSNTQRAVAMYPSPAGATECLLPLTGWESLVAANPSLTEMREDTEALLVNRLQPTPQYFIVPIDLCFELVGLIRLHWRGLSGGEEVWRQIDLFFEKVRLSIGGLEKRAAEVTRA